MTDMTTEGQRPEARARTIVRITAWLFMTLSGSLIAGGLYFGVDALDLIVVAVVFFAPAALLLRGKYPIAAATLGVASGFVWFLMFVATIYEFAAGRPNRGLSMLVLFALSAIPFLASSRAYKAAKALKEPPLIPVPELFE